MKLTFWMDIITPHWQHTLASLAELAGESVQVYADNPGNASERAAFGWSDDLLGARNVHVAAKPAGPALAAGDWRAGVHVICNPLNNPTNRLLLPILDQQGAAYGFQQSRPGLISGPVGQVLRSLAYRTVFRPRLNRARFILCHGEFCRRYLLDAGVRPAVLFDSGYFVPQEAELDAELARHPRADGPARFVFLGQFIDRKQVLPLAAALHTAGGPQDWTLDFIGNGAQKDELTAQAWRAGVRVLPPIGYGTVVRTLAAYDCLVLPSRADEWAVVINEAIHAGCAVICTDRCGGADLVRHGGCGVVARDAAGCAKALIALAGDPARLAGYRAAARRLAPRITSPRGAAYLWAVIQHALHGGPRPQPPWLHD